MYATAKSLFTAACVLFLAHLSPARADDAYKAGPGAYTFKMTDEIWHDTGRNRDVPVRVYIPQPDTGQKFPVIVFSHGLGGSRAGYVYFGEHMASNGYIVILPTHAGSDTKAMFGGRAERGAGNGRAGAKAGAEGGGRMLESLDDPSNLRNRPLDISFVIDQLSVSATLRNIADTSRIGVAGHSFGAYTAMAIGGMLVDLPDAPKQSFRDPRVKAVLPMSPEGPGTMGITKGSWSAFATPVFFLTGTKDYGQGERSATWRRAGFESITTVDDYLATLDDATHMTFANPGGKLDGGIGAGGLTRTRHAELINSFCAAFFDAYVNGDPKAKAWLTTFFAAKHTDCTAEFRAPSTNGAPAAPAK